MIKCYYNDKKYLNYQIPTAISSFDENKFESCKPINQ